MIIAEIRAFDLGDWRGRLRDTETGEAIGTEWRAPQRGALISLIRKWVPVTHLTFVDVGDLSFD